MDDQRMKTEHMNNTPQVRAIMSLIQDARLARGYSRADMASMITDQCSYRVTEDQYRAAEQGITKHVTLDLALFAVKILDLDESLFAVAWQHPTA
jgi:hypothetical protein